MPYLKSSALAWLRVSALAIIADQASKWWVLTHTFPGQQIPVIDGFLYRTLAFNRGAAFSFLADGSGWQRWFFVVLAVAISLGMGVWLWRTPRRDWRTALPLALIIGGALGNLIDRVRSGEVTDFVLVYFGHWPYPAFNVADACISVGAVMLVVFGLFGGKPRADVP